MRSYSFWEFLNMHLIRNSKNDYIIIIAYSTAFLWLILNELAQRHLLLWINVISVCYSVVMSLLHRKQRSNVNMIDFTVLTAKRWSWTHLIFKNIEDRKRNTFDLFPLVNCGFNRNWNLSKLTYFHSNFWFIGWSK